MHSGICKKNDVSEILLTVFFDAGRNGFFEFDILIMRSGESFKKGRECMNEIMSLMNRDISGWMCSGDDEAVTTIVFKNLLYKAAEQRFVQVVIASEDMLPTVSRIVESDSRNKGYLPSYAHRYFPAFSGSDVDMKERMVEILKRCRVDQDKADDVMAYIDFLTELESEIVEDNHARDETLLQKYLRASAVERALNTAVANGEITQDECRDWFEDYSDCSSGRIHLKRIMNRLNRSFSLNKDRSKSISALGQGDRLCFIIKSDMSEDMKELMFEMIGWDILEAKRSGKQVSLIVLEGCKKYGNELLRLLNVSSADINFNFFAKDYFSGHTADWSEQIDEYFRRYIYTAHSRMESCEEISSKRFGQIPVVRNSYACDRDRRISNNRVLDRLLDTNRVDHYVQHVPVWEAQYRKEEIHDMQKGICLVQADTFEGYVDLRR